MFPFLLTVLFALAAPRVAVLDLDNRTGDASLDGAGAGVAGILVAKLVRVDTLEVVERERLADVLGEIALGKSGAVDATTAAKAGKLLGASHFVAGEIVSVKLPAVALALRVVEVETGKVVAATDVVGEVGASGEEFFVLVDDAAFQIVDALQVKLAAKDRIELGQVDVRQLSTIEVYGDALRAMDRGDGKAARTLLTAALAAEPGFRLAEDALAKLAAEVAAIRQDYAHEALTRVHAAWDATEKAVAGTLPAAPTVPDLAAAAVRARMRLVRGDLEGYLTLETERLARTPTVLRPDNEFDDTIKALVTDDYTRRRTLDGLSVWPFEVRDQIAEILLLLGQTGAAEKLVVENWQRPGPMPYASSRPHTPEYMAERLDLVDLLVSARRQALRQAELRGREEEIKRALTALDKAVAEAQEARTLRASWDAVQKRVGKERASTSLAREEELSLRAADKDRALILSGYQAFRTRVTSGWYDPVRTSSEFRGLAERWEAKVQRVWNDGWAVDRALATELEFLEHVPARDAEDEARRRKSLDEFVNGAYGR